MAVARAVYHLEFRPYRREFHQPLVTARGLWAFREGVIVRLTDSAGRIGYGEAAPIPGFTHETTAADLIWLGRARASITDKIISKIPARLSCLRWAFECVQAMLENRLQPPVRGKFLSVAALLPPGRDALDMLRKRQRQGYHVFKWKIGVPPAVEELALLPKLLAMLPRGGKLRLDANGALRARNWLVWRRELESLGSLADAIEFIEQPLRRRIKLSAPVPVTWDESVAGFASLRRARGRGPLVVKPSLLGDLRGFLRWRAQASADLVYSSAFETSVGLHAALCLAASDPRAGERALGFGTLGAFADDGLQLPAHAPGPKIRPTKLIAEDFLEIWECLSHAV